MKNYILLSLFAFFAISCSSDNDSTKSETSVGIECIKCEEMEVGETFIKNGVTYTVVDDELLGKAVAEGWDMKTVCTSNVTSMRDLFRDNETFNDDISQWDVSNVTVFKKMFARTKAFNQNIGSWDVSKGENFFKMFEGAEAFNQDIGSWNTQSAKDMGKMFQGTKAFNQDISDWDVSSVESFFSMFEYAEAFNQDLSSWEVSLARVVDGFDHCREFSKDAANWTLPKPNFTNCDCGCK